jgi:hypothetical protein
MGPLEIVLLILLVLILVGGFAVSKVIWVLIIVLLLVLVLSHVGPWARGPRGPRY